MRKIINGLRYDTETAVEVGRASSGFPVSDFNWWESTLYKTPRSGRFFLAGEGGPMTRFAQRVGDMRGYGEGLFPMERTEALAWAEQYLTADEIEKHFGDNVEDA